MNRTSLINYFINQYNFTRYLEIGVYNEAHNFCHIQCDHKVGVDVNPVTTFCGSSDEFFKMNNERFDLIFIDGLHTEQQVLKDIRNAFTCLTEGGVIILHDCLPASDWHQREGEQFIDGEEWNGTVWKAALRVFNETVFHCTVVNDDYGCGIIDTNKKQTPLQLNLPVNLTYDEHFPLLLRYKMESTDFLKHQVKVFYHLACLNNWQQVFDEQIQQLAQHLFTTIHLTVLGTKEDQSKAILMIRNLGITVNLIFESDNLACYEQPAMLAIQEHVRDNSGFVLYLHSKGVSNVLSPVKTNWRRLMMNQLIANSSHCLQQLPYYDAIGVNWCDSPPHFSGNFWYAATGYLRSLKSFQTFYRNNQPAFPDPYDPGRLNCEFWIGSSEKLPNILSLVCRNVNFYECGDNFWREHLNGEFVRGSTIGSQSSELS